MRMQWTKPPAAALITEYEAIREDMPVGAREASVAITNMQTTSMWGVSAATTNLT
jgi:hypothetical protein